ncbi:MAG TPA: amino acid adenylation domain-containing protein, partial [Blastocatellia bacterium]
PIAGRNRIEIEGLIGCFINTLALRIKLDGDPQWRQLLGRVREATLGAYAHQDLAFEKLVQELRPERDMSRSPLFQVMLVLQNAPQEGFQLRGLNMKGLRVEDTTAEFELTLVFSELKEGLYGTVEFNKTLFEESTIRRMVRHYEQVLASLADDPARSVSGVELLAGHERQQIIEEWNSLEVVDGGQTLVALLQAQVETGSDRPAVISDTGSLTYGELDARSSRLARYLKKIGVGPDVMVGICLERSLEMIVSLIGVMKAGGAYVPLDPKYPRERLAYLIEDSAARTVITETGLEHSFPATQCRAVRLDSDWAEIASQSEEALCQDAMPASLAYVIYTSGSTGLPKGVQVSIGSLTNYSVAFSAEHAIGPWDRVLQFASLSFDTSAEEIYPALISGAVLVLRTDAVLGSGVEFFNEILQHDITVLDLPTAFWHTLTDGIRGNTKLEYLPRLLIIGGERALGEPLAEWSRLLGSQGRLVNTYGPTESTIVALRCVMVGPASIVFDDEPPIGRPVPGAHAFIAARPAELASVGVVGEICIGGRGLARGYLNNADLTAERFVPNAYRREPGARLYRTGDLGRYRHDGNIEYRGRTDHQVKIRGYRVELAEIEAVLCQFWEIREAVVAARENIPGQLLLVAYIVGEEGVDPNPREIQAYLKERLPAFMVPQIFVVLDRLPLTSSGKIDRGALPAPEVDAHHSNEILAPRTPIEEVTCNIWSAVLRLPMVGVHDNFFEIGGHSLLATQAISRMREAFAVEVAVRQLFENPTPSEMAAIIEHRLRDSKSLASPVILPADRSRPLPLSYAQQRLWFIEQLRPDTPAYNMARAIRISGELNIDHLNRTLTEITRRHESLRTHFPEVDGQVVQMISPPSPFHVRQLSLPNLPAEDENLALASFVVNEVRQPCNLAEGPLFRATLASLGEQDHVLIMVLHHIISDGWSMSVFFAELNALYGAYSRGEKSPLADPCVQYADYTVWQQEWLTDDILREQISYWRNQLNGAPTLLELPTDRPRQQLQTYRAGYQTLRLPAELIGELVALSKREGVTLFMTLVATFEELLARYSGQDDIVVGTPVAGRSRSELEGLIGLFVNTLPLRVDLSGQPTFRELLRRTREVCLGAYAHQDAPFEKIVEDLSPERSTRHTPLYQVVFALQNAPWQNVDLSGLALSAINASNGTANYDLSFSVAEEGAWLGRGAGGWIEYQADIFDADTISRLVRHYVNLLQAAVSVPEAPVAELSLLTASEADQLRSEWNETTRPYPRNKTVAALFEEQVELKPEAAAIVSGRGVCTYGELN